MALSRIQAIFGIPSHISQDSEFLHLALLAAPPDNDDVREVHIRGDIQNLDSFRNVFNLGLTPGLEL